MSTTNDPAPYESRPIDPDFQSYVKRGFQKCYDQPLVPLGTVATCMALGLAFRELRRGNSKQLNKYLRLRVIAQGATVAAMVGGWAYTNTGLMAKKQVKEQEEKEKIQGFLDRAGPSVPPTPATSKSLPSELNAPPVAAAPSTTSQNDEEYVPVTTTKPPPVPPKQFSMKSGSKEGWDEFLKKTDASHLGSGSLSPLSRKSGPTPSSSDSPASPVSSESASVAPATTVPELKHAPNDVKGSTTVDDKPKSSSGGWSSWIPGFGGSK